MWTNILKAKLSLTELRMLKELMADGEWRTTRQIIEELGWDLNRTKAVSARLKKLEYSFESRWVEIRRDAHPNNKDRVAEWRKRRD